MTTAALNRMTCRYCGSANDSDAHRCVRCGRRLHLASARPAPDAYPVAGSRALAVQPRTVPLTRPSATDEADPQVERPRRNPVQATLFQTREIGRVVPIQAFQKPPQPSSRAQRQARSEPANTSDALVELHQQAYFQFPSTQNPRRAGVNEHARFSKAPIAIPVHRVMAALLDFSLVLIAVALVAIVLYGILGKDFLQGSTLSFFALMSAFFTLSYKLMWALVGAESPGLRWTQLRLLTWDGSEPTREDRLRRLAWGCVSVLPAGLGLIWALVDEETLTWHDHSSKTFLTSFSENGPRD